MAIITTRSGKSYFSPQEQHRLAEEDRTGGWKVAGILVSEITAGLVMGLIVVIAICAMG